MKPFVVFVVVLVAAAAVLGAYPATVRADHPVPFKGTMDYAFTGPGPGNSREFDGVGVGTHTGLSTVVAFVVPHRDPRNYDVSGTITAANGDQIFFVNGHATFNPIDPQHPLIATADGTAEIMGGTGRFTNATGEFSFHDEFTLDPVTGRVSTDHQTYKGVISY
jgi:hypothetical protein